MLWLLIKKWKNFSFFFHFVVDVFHLLFSKLYLVGYSMKGNSTFQTKTKINEFFEFRTFFLKLVIHSSRSIDSIFLTPNWIIALFRWFVRSIHDYDNDIDLIRFFFDFWLKKKLINFGPINYFMLLTLLHANDDDDSVM